MIEEVIKYDTAILAIEKKFDVHCKDYYDTDSKELYTNEDFPWNSYTDSLWAPTQSLVQKWLREVHKIDLIPTMSEFSRTYGYKLFYIEKGKTVCINNMYSKNESFEQALEIGLQEALKLIK